MISGKEYLTEEKESKILGKLCKLSHREAACGDLISSHCRASSWNSWEKRKKAIKTTSIHAMSYENNDLELNCEKNGRIGNCCKMKGRNAIVRKTTK